MTPRQATTKASEHIRALMQQLSSKQCVEFLENISDECAVRAEALQSEIDAAESTPDEDAVEGDF